MVKILAASAVLIPLALGPSRPELSDDGGAPTSCGGRYPSDDASKIICEISRKFQASFDTSSMAYVVANNERAAEFCGFRLSSAYQCFKSKTPQEANAGQVYAFLARTIPATPPLGVRDKRAYCAEHYKAFGPGNGWIEFYQ